MGVAASSPRNAVNVSTIVGDFEHQQQQQQQQQQQNCCRAEQNSSFDYCNNADFSKVSSGPPYRTSFIGSLNWKKPTAPKRKEKSLWMRIASRLSGKINHHYNHHHQLHQHQHQHHQFQQQQQQSLAAAAGTMAKDEDLENNNENRFDSCLVPPTSHPLLLKHLSGGVCPAKRTPVSTIAYGDRILREISVKTTNVNGCYDSANSLAKLRCSSNHVTSPQNGKHRCTRAVAAAPLAAGRCNNNNNNSGGVFVPNHHHHHHHHHPHRRTVQLQASTSELLACVGEFLETRCVRLRHFRGPEAVGWIRAVDQALVANGWQEIAFLNPTNVIFLYMLARDVVETDIVTATELRSTVHACLYLSYSYMGNEISYPVRPFLAVDEDRKRFWHRCLRIVTEMSARMLRLNRDPDFFASLFKELKSYSYVVGKSAFLQARNRISGDLLPSDPPPPPPPPPPPSPSPPPPPPLCQIPTLRMVTKTSSPDGISAALTASVTDDRQVSESSLVKKSNC